MRAPRPSDLPIRLLGAVCVVVLAVVLVATSVIMGVETHTELAASARPGADRPAEQVGPEPVQGAGPASTGDAQTDAVLDEIARFVEVERGLAFQAPVEVEVLVDGPFQDRLFASVEKEADQLRTDAQALQALGFVDDVGEIERGMRRLYTSGVLGFYDPDTGELVVRGDGLGPSTRQTIAHELTHALDDQWFDLGKPEYDERVDEVGFGVAALAEGNARRIDQAYESELTAAERKELRDEANRVGGEPPASVPPVLIALIQAPYELGEALVKEILARGDQPQLDDAFRTPPRTSEQVIDVEKWSARESAVPVAPPPADGTVLDQGMLGELAVRLVIGQSLGRGRVNRAGAGWGGDQYVLWQQGDGYCLRVDIAADTPADLAEIDDALRDTAKDLPAAEVESPQPDRVRFTSCN